jgi:diguanylate cyclase (GGDEF)-like protein/PAS domain S-box-containing protein
MNEFENFFNFSLDPMTIADVNGNIIHANRVYTAITGWSVDELKGMTYWELIHTDDHEKVSTALQTLQAGHPVLALEYKFLCKDGSYKAFLVNVNRDSETGHLYAISRLLDGQIVPYASVAHITPVAMIIVNDRGVIVHTNPLADNLFQYKSSELLGELIEKLIPSNLHKKHEVQRLSYQMKPTSRPMGSHDNLKGLKKSGEEFNVDIALNPLHEGNELYVACSIFDISEKMDTARLAANLEEENIRLSNLVQRDPLTEIYNRRAMDEIFPHIVEECQRSKKNISAILLDIDHFKLFNDTHGHQQGDLLLKQIAETSQGNIRGNDILVRYGGEEFIIIMPNCGQRQANEVAERIRLSFERDKSIKHQITASFGISTYTFNDLQLSANEILARLIEEADKALYTAKAGGRNRIQHFSAH